MVSSVNPPSPAALKHVMRAGVDNTLSTEPHSSIAVVFTLKRAVNVDTDMNCMFQPLWDQLVNTAGHNQQRRNTSWPSTLKCFRTKPFAKFNRSQINTVIRDKTATHIQHEVGILVRLKQINGSSTGYKHQRLSCVGKRWDRFCRPWFPSKTSTNQAVPAHGS